ncbi:hypothetical protein [Sulfurirhabdus autotrophica]|uniref:Uncharacterized protein n=1 Tax=Sulfurirhabdus autotrophica TaxID=1706046 RepID=A0A4R3XVG2_9PROT|nr:hypothetical protein [Sulfurirhabdus autotrophica]TCV82907.1 hypothetical protein EDC63_11836 [Sulfurirhabdus autotrophica]
MRTIFVVVLLLLTAISAQAQDTSSSQRLQKLDKLQRESETWAAKQEGIARERKNACINAFGHREFCECLSQELHWIITFENYIGAVTIPSAYVPVNSDEKSIIASASRARSVCVARYFGAK